MNLSFVLRDWAAWSPGIEGKAAWTEWAAGTRRTEQSSVSPSLPFLDTMFKRRLSQLSKMVLHVGHEAAEGKTSLKVAFGSHYGEIGQQLKISSLLNDSGEVSPASFSLSVFNAPVALLSIAEKNTGRASAIYAGAESFETTLLSALALLKHSGDDEVLCVVGDELLPESYETLKPGRNIPYALALLIGKNGSEGRKIGLNIEHCSSAEEIRNGGAAELPPALGFLRWLVAAGSPEHAISGAHMRLRFS